MINILFQAYRTLSDDNVSTLSGLFVYVSSQSSLFTPMLLLSLFIIMTMSIVYGQKRTGGDSNFFGAMSVSSYFVFVVAMVMSLIENLISTWLIVICLSISVLTTILYLISKERD